MRPKDRRRAKASQEQAAGAADDHFHYSEADRAAIAPTLPIEARHQIDAAIAELERSGQQYLIDRVRRKDDRRAATRTRQQLAALIKFERLMEDDPDWDGARHGQERERLARVSEAYARLNVAFHGADLDKETLYFRALSVWDDLKGPLGTRWYTPTSLKRFMVAVTEPLLGRQAPKRSSLNRIKARYLEACQRGGFGTVTEVKIDGAPVIVGIDRFIMLSNSDPTHKACKK
jgi:hypothetical protein